jgi:hypothetical protein
MANPQYDTMQENRGQMAIVKFGQKFDNSWKDTANQ